MVSTPNIEKIFHDKAVYPSAWKDGNYAIEVREIGLLNLVSGSIVACDPFYYPGSSIEPFAIQVESGCYPVRLSIAHVEKHGPIVMAAMLLFSDQIPVNWAMALHEDEAIETLKDDEAFGFGVETGEAGYMDFETFKILDRSRVNEPDFASFMANELAKQAPIDWANIMVEDTRHLNAMLFRSGMGDGFYASYWGYASDGQITCLVTVFDDMEPEETP
jgi:hypothetical protein